MHEYDYKGNTYYKGMKDGFDVCASIFGVRIGNQSIPKWHLGDNYKILSRTTTKEAIERLSDEFCLPMGLANVTRVDVGFQLPLKHPLGEYLCMFGATASQMAKKTYKGSVYYQNYYRELCFYDKPKEQQAHHECQNYSGYNIMRYELRLKSQITRQLKVKELTASALYDSEVWRKFVTLWYNEYMRVEKLNPDQSFDTDIASIKDLQRVGVRMFILKSGGVEACLKSLKNLNNLGCIQETPYKRLRAYIRRVAKEQPKEVPELITELNTKIKNIWRHQR